MAGLDNDRNNLGAHYLVKLHRIAKQLPWQERFMQDKSGNRQHKIIRIAIFLGCLYNFVAYNNESQ